MAKYVKKASSSAQSEASTSATSDIRSTGARDTKPTGVNSVMQNPSEHGTPKVAYNSTARNDLMGFANRSEKVTQNQSSYPTVLPKLGYSFNRYASAAEAPRYGSLPHPEWYGSWKSTTYSYSTPGIMSLEFEPMMAIESPLLPAELDSIFQAEHMEMRIFNNATRGFSASDLHVMWLGLAELNCHIQAFKRILKVVARMVNHELNEFYSTDAMLAALGFPMTKAEARENYVNWYSKFNTDVIDQLKRVKWFKDERIMPGWKRWGAMCTEVYKDTPMYTDYCQMYVLTRSSFMDIKTELTQQDVYNWVFTKSSIGSFAPSSTTGVADLTEYLNKIVKLVQHLFFDPGVSAVISCINTIYARNNNSGIEFESLDFGNTTLWEEDLKLTYNFNMLLAIHNATICEVFVDPPHVDVENDRVRQTAYVAHRRYSGSASSIFLSPKLINMPNFGASMNDMIDATQWTVVGSEVGATAGPGDYGMSVVPGSVGTDVITKAHIYRFRWDSNDPNEYALTVTDLYSNGIWLSYQTKRELIDFASIMQDFAFSPILYIVDDEEGYAEDPQIMDMLAQTEVEYVADWNHLSEMHRQFVRNFWGYPAYPETIGTFSTSYENAQR